MGLGAYQPSAGTPQHGPVRWTGPSASHANGPDVFRLIAEDWGRRQPLLGFSDRLRCEQIDGSGWEFHRGASFSASSRRLTEDDTTLQVVALFQPLSPHRWNDLLSSYADINHQDFAQLGDARFTATDATGLPVCVFLVNNLAVRVRMTGTLANRQYSRVYALDVCNNIDHEAVQLWSNSVSHLV
jgi:hypothetical protein